MASPKSYTHACIRQTLHDNLTKVIGLSASRASAALAGFDCRSTVATVSNRTIMSARDKPPGCSDVRWRMELRRRLNKEYYGLCN